MTADKTIIASFNDLQQAQGAIEALEQSGVERQRISVATQDRSDGEIAARGAPSCPDEGSPHWSALLIGAASMAAAGGLSAIPFAAATAPGVGPVLVFGSLFSVLFALEGAAWGRAIDSIAAAEVSPECAHTCKERLQRGDTVLAVSASRPETRRARGILSTHKAREICLVG
jgi:hypothetical protein